MLKEVAVGAVKRLHAFAERSGLAARLWPAAMFLRGVWVRRQVERRSAQPRSLSVFDFGYYHTRGHHHALNRLILETADAMGIPAEVLAQRYIEPGLCSPVVRPAFRAHVYGFVQDQAALEHKRRTILARTREDMLFLPLARLTNADAVILIHTTTPWHLLAVMETLAACAARCRVNVFLMLPPGFDMPTELEPQQSAAYLAAWRLARRHRLNIHFWAENPLLRDAFRDLGLGDVAQAALPAWPSPTPAPRTAATGATRPVFLFIGEPRKEKGFGLVLSAISLAKERSMAVTFRLRLTAISEDETALLRQFSRDLVDVQVEGHFSDAAYFADLARADAVLLPYDPVEYRVKNSNIVSESIASGTPVIVPGGANSLMDFANTLDKACHAAMPEYSAAGLCAAIEHAAPRISEMQAAARQAAQGIVAYRSPSAFISKMMGPGGSL